MNDKESNQANTPPPERPTWDLELASGGQPAEGSTASAPTDPQSTDARSTASAPTDPQSTDPQSTAPAPTGLQPTGWPPASQPGWPPNQAPQPGWPPNQAPAPGWPPAQQSWPQSQWAAPPSWPPAQQPWPPVQNAAPQPGWPPSQQQWPPSQQQWPPSREPGWPPVGGSGDFSTSGSASSHRPNRWPWIAGIAVAALIAFSTGMVVDRSVVSAQQQPQVSANQPLENFSTYEEALQDVKANFVGRDSVTDKQLLYGSISGMVDSLGDTDHTRFLTPEEYAQLQTGLKGSIGGIGVILDNINGNIVVDRVITDSPAEKAGIKAGDSITEVNGKSTTGMTFQQLADLVRGDPGTQVNITVVHAGSTTPIELTITRAEVKAPLVDWGMVPGTNVADIALFEFGSGAADQIHAAVTAATKAGASAIVLDMRGNPGGLAIEARNVASEFLSTGVIYQEENASGKISSVTVDTSRGSTSLPIVVLIDHDTASAAEIVSGALQDNLRAKLVGQTTVGTGTVLQPFVLKDGSALLLAVTDWLTPAGHRIFGVGIKPDQAVAMPTGGQPIDPVKLSGMTASSVTSSGDAQLLAALQLLGQSPK